MKAHLALSLCCHNTDTSNIPLTSLCSIIPEVIDTQTVLVHYWKNYWLFCHFHNWQDINIDISTALILIHWLSVILCLISSSVQSGLETTTHIPINFTDVVLSNIQHARNIKCHNVCIIVPEGAMRHLATTTYNNISNTMHEIRQWDGESAQNCSMLANVCVS